jgi:hypothetical protein
VVTGWCAVAQAAAPVAPIAGHWICQAGESNHFDTTMSHHHRPITLRSALGASSPLRFQDRWLAAPLARELATVDVGVRLWNGYSPWTASRRSRDAAGPGRRTLFGLIVDPELWFGGAYITGRLQVQGGLEPVLEAI